jgi:ketosteroid isomerase-like protein
MFCSCTTQRETFSFWLHLAVVFDTRDGGSGMVNGRAAIEALWKSMAEQVSDPKLTTLDVKPLGPSTAREIGTFSLKTKGPTPQEVTGKYVVVWEKIGSDWKLATDIWNDGK